MTINEFAKKRPYLFWSTRNLEYLSKEAIVEGVLNYGNWNDVQALIKILGMKKMAKIFREKSKPSKIGRQNYHKKTKNYFSLYFNKHAPT